MTETSNRWNCDDCGGFPKVYVTKEHEDTFCPNCEDHSERVAEHNA